MFKPRLCYALKNTTTKTGDKIIFKFTYLQTNLYILTIKTINFNVKHLFCVGYIKVINLIKIGLKIIISRLIVRFYPLID